MDSPRPSFVVSETPPAQAAAPAFRHFHPERLGGRFILHLEKNLLGRLAECLHLFRDSPTLARLHLRDTVARTARRGGYPCRVRRPAAPPRQVWVLVDGAAPDMRWNPLPEELAAGLEGYGLNVTLARFSLTRTGLEIQATPGVTRTLIDLEAERGRSLLLLFSDGSGLRRPGSRFALEHLRHWPLLAWLEMRDERAWDETTALPARQSIPVFPATPEGLVEMTRTFLSERGSGYDFRRDARHWQGFELTRNFSIRLPVTVERILGDARPWAQACAMLPPPLGLGLANQLRRKFYPHLPSNRLGRLLALPGGVQQADGLLLPPLVLAVLRSGFARQDAALQQEILLYLMEILRANEPDDPSAPAHREWTWYLARLHLELDPDAALPVIAQLAQEAPLAERVRADLALTGLPVERGALTYARIPLRLKPCTHQGLKLLHGLVPDCGIAYAELEPLRFRLWYALDYLHSLRVRGRKVAAFSPDGEWVVEASLDRHARLWDSRNGEERCFLPGGIQDTYRDAQQPVRTWLRRLGDVSSLLADFSPDGTRVVTLLNDNTVRIWDSRDGGVLYLLKGARIWLRSAVFSADGEQILAVTSNGEVWDIAKGRLIRVLAGHTRFIGGAALSPDGARIATASADRTLRVWELDSGRCLKVLSGHRDRVYGVQFAPDGAHLVSASADKTARVWDAAAGACAQVLQGHTRRVNSARFSPDGQWIVTASADKTARVWDRASGETLQVLRGHTRQVNSAGFSPDGRQVLTAGDDSVHIWEMGEIEEA